MLYITTTKLIGSIPDELEENSSVSVFYKAGESLKVDDVEKLLTIPAHISFEEYAGRDDMLVIIGMKLVSEERICYIDPSLPIPKRFEKNITVTGKKQTKKRAARKPSSAPVTPANDRTAEQASAGGNSDNAGSAKKDEPEDNDSSHIATDDIVSVSEAVESKSSNEFETNEHSVEPLAQMETGTDETVVKSKPDSSQSDELPIVNRQPDGEFPKRSARRGSVSANTDTDMGPVICEGCRHSSKRGLFYACSLKNTGFSRVTFTTCKDREVVG